MGQPPSDADGLRNGVDVKKVGVDDGLAPVRLAE